LETAEYADVLLDVEAVQKILGVGANTAREAMHAAGALKIGHRTLRVKKRDLDVWIEAQREPRPDLPRVPLAILPSHQ